MKKNAQKLISWLANAKIISFPRKLAREAMISFLQNKKMVVLDYGGSGNGKIIDLANKKIYF